MKRGDRHDREWFDDLLISPARLGIVAALAAGESLTFTELKRTTRLSDGNLHVQTRKLEGAGYVRMSQVTKGRKTVTTFSLTNEGLHALKFLTRKLQALLASKGGIMRPSAPPPRPDGSQVWQAKGQRTRPAAKEVS